MGDSRNKNADFWHRPNRPMCLGCFVCPHLATCGGISIDFSVSDCFDFCQCRPGSKCPFVCPSKPREFVARLREIGGFELDNIPGADPVAWPCMPLMVPLVPNGYSRSMKLDVPAVGLP